MTTSISERSHQNGARWAGDANAVGSELPVFDYMKMMTGEYQPPYGVLFRVVNYNLFPARNSPSVWDPCGMRVSEKRDFPEGWHFGSRFFKSTGSWMHLLHNANDWTTMIGIHYAPGEGWSRKTAKERLVSYAVSELGAPRPLSDRGGHGPVRLRFRGLTTVATVALIAGSLPGASATVFGTVATAINWHWTLFSVIFGLFGSTISGMVDNSYFDYFVSTVRAAAYSFFFVYAIITGNLAMILNITLSQLISLFGKTKIFRKGCKGLRGILIRFGQFGSEVVQTVRKTLTLRNVALHLRKYWYLYVALFGAVVYYLRRNKVRSFEDMQRDKHRSRIAVLIAGTLATIVGFKSVDKVAAWSKTFVFSKQVFEYVTSIKDVCSYIFDASYCDVFQAKGKEKQEVKFESRGDIAQHKLTDADAVSSEDFLASLQQTWETVEDLETDHEDEALSKRAPEAPAVIKEAAAENDWEIQKIRALTKQGYTRDQIASFIMNMRSGLEKRIARQQKIRPKIKQESSDSDKPAPEGFRRSSTPVMDDESPAYHAVPPPPKNADLVGVILEMFSKTGELHDNAKKTLGKCYIPAVLVGIVVILACVWCFFVGPETKKKLRKRANDFVPTFEGKGKTKHTMRGFASRSVGRQRRAPNYIPSGDIEEVYDVLSKDYVSWNSGLQKGKYVVYYQDGSHMELDIVDSNGVELEGGSFFSAGEAVTHQIGKTLSEIPNFDVSANKEGLLHMIKNFLGRYQPQRPWKDVEYLPGQHPFVRDCEQVAAFDKKTEVVQASVDESASKDPLVQPVIPVVSSVAVPSSNGNFVLDESVRAESIGKGNVLPDAPKKANRNNVKGPIPKGLFCDICNTCLNPARRNLCNTHNTVDHKQHCYVCVKNGECQQYKSFHAGERVKVEEKIAPRSLQSIRVSNFLQKTKDESFNSLRVKLESLGNGHSTKDFSDSACLLYDRDRNFVGHGFCVLGRLFFMTHFDRPHFWRRPGTDTWHHIPANATVVNDGELACFTNYVPDGLKSIKLKDLAVPVSGKQSVLRYWKAWENEDPVISPSLIGEHISNTTAYTYGADTRDGVCGAIVSCGGKVVGFHCYGLAGNKNAFEAVTENRLLFFRQMGGSQPPATSN
jgi:hypothetical protein